MSSQGRRLAAIEAALAREGLAQRQAGAADVVAAELRDAGCVAEVCGGVVVVDEGRDDRPDAPEHLASRLHSLAARDPAFAAVTVVVITALDPPLREGGNRHGWVVAGDTLYGPSTDEVARGTVAELGGHGSCDRTSRSSTNEKGDEKP